MSILLSPIVSHAVTVRGAGHDCAKWLDDRQRGGPQSSVWEAFIQGIVNGYAMGADKEIWMATGKSEMSASALFYLMDQHCRNNPTHDMIQAVNSIIDVRISKSK